MMNYLELFVLMMHSRNSPESYIAILLWTCKEWWFVLGRVLAVGFELDRLTSSHGVLMSVFWALSIALEQTATDQLGIHLNVS
jgi:hypothetical protein